MSVVVVLVAAIAMTVMAAVAGAATVPLRLPDGKAAGGGPKLMTVQAREALGEWTAESRTYALPDGRRVARVFGQPVNFRDAQGDWRGIDNRLVEQPTGRLGNAANRFDVGLPARLEDGPVRVTHGSASVTLEPLGGHGVGTVSGATQRFEQAFPGTAVEYEAIDQGVKETLVLYGSDAPRAFRFRVNAGDGMRLDPGRGGRVDVLDGDGSVRFVLPVPVMWDADDASPSMHEVAASTARNADGSVEVVYTPDADWVAGRLAAGHNVAIDPTISVGPAPDCTLTKATPSTSDCASGLLTVGAANGGSDHHALLNFDVKTAVPNNVEVEEGWLETTLASTLNSSAESVGVYNVTRSWTSAATWNTYNGTNNWTTAGGDVSASAELSQTIDPCCLGTYYWSITGLAKKWISGAQAQNGLLLKQTSATATNEFRFNSNESSGTKPSFNVSYTPRTGSVKGLAQDGQPLNDRSNASVELSGGNLLYTAGDLHIAGTAGQDLALTRVYNSRESFDEEMSFGWRLEPADTELVVSGGQAGAGGAVEWIGPGGERKMFFRKVGNATDYTTPIGLDATLTAVAGTNYHSFELVFNGSQEKWKYSGCGQGCDAHLDSVEDRTAANKVSFTYDAIQTEKLTGVTDTQGRTVTPRYNTAGRLDQLTVKKSDGTTIRTLGYGYDANNKLTSYTDGDGKVTTYAYEPNGNLSQITSPESRVTKITYVNPASGDDRVKDITRIDNPGTGTGPKTSYSYQALDTNTCGGGDAATPNVGTTVVTDAKSHVTTYCWDSEGRMNKVLDAKGNVRESSYSPNSDPISASAGTGVTEKATGTATYDTASVGGANPTFNLTSGTMPKLAGETRTGAFSVNYDAAFKYQPSDVTGTSGAKFTYAYNTQGNLSTVTDSLTPNNTAHLQWNGEGNGSCSPSGSVDDTGKTGTLRCAIDGNANKRIYSYDSAGNLTKITPPGGTTLQGETVIVPDTFSRPQSITDGKGQARTLTYDGNDRVKSVTWATGNSVTYTYDGDGNVTDQVDSIAGTSSFTFDKLNRLTHQGLPGSRSTDYTYDAASNLETVVDAGGTVTYSYDEADRLSGVADPTGSCSAPVSKCTSYGYDTRNNPLTVTFPNTVKVSQAFDGSDHVTRISAQKGTVTPLLVDLNYTYEDAATPIRRTDLRQSVADLIAHKKTTYTYDGQDRLTRALAKNGDTGTGSLISDHTWTFDGANNRLTQKIDTGGGASTPVTYYGYNAVNELCWLKTTTTNPATSGCTPPSGATSLAYDNNGNQTTDNAGTAGRYAYNLRDQLSTFEGSTFGYNGAGNGSLLSAGTVTYNESLLGTSSRTGVTTGTAYFTRDPAGGLVTDRDPSGSYYYIHDALGSVVALTDSTGAVAKSYSYDPSGKVTTGAGSLAQYFRYAGGLQPTSSTTLTKFGQRYYDPETARWTQPDPLDQAGSLREANLYLYVGADPINNVDPAGLRCADAACYGPGSRTTTLTKGCLIGQCPRQPKRKTTRCLEPGQQWASIEIPCEAHSPEPEPFNPDLPTPMRPSPKIPVPLPRPVPIPVP